MSINLYDNGSAIAQMVSAGKHREAVGGNFDTIGQQHLDLLVSEGLRPEHFLLDIGCGCLRSGIKFIPYLDAGHYYGTDISKALLDAGYDVELAAAGLQHKLPRDNLVADGTFDFSWVTRKFDFAMAQSVFTHLPLDRFAICLERLRHVMKPGGRLYATFFEIPEDHPRHEPFTFGRIVTHGDKDPFHFRWSDIERIAPPWTVERMKTTRFAQPLVRLSLL